MVLYGAAIRSRLLRGAELRKSTFRFVVEISAMIYISRNWTVDETISEVLLHQYSGRKTYGLDDAAQLYFGLSLEELNEFQLFVLFRLPKAPSRYDPWCFPEKLIRSTETYLENHDLPYSCSDLNLLAKPVGECV